MRQGLSTRGLVIVVAGIAAGAAVLAGQGLASAAPRKTPPAQRPGKTRVPSFLFAHDAAGGTFTAVRGRPGVYRIALTGVRGSALYFSNRPGRLVGSIPLGRALAGLLHKKGESRPNAAVNTVDSTGSQVLMGVELLRGAYDWKRHTLVYTVRRLRQGRVQDRKPGLTDRVLPARLGHTSVFIDVIYNTCSATIVNQTTQEWTLQSATIGSDDSWGAYGIGYPTSFGPTALEELYGETSGFSQGCSDTVVWEGADGTILTVSLSDPWAGTNTWSCTVSTPTYSCIDVDPGDQSDDLSVTFLLAPASSTAGRSNQ